MKKVMVFGTFDIFHPGHKNFFKQAKNFGDFLIVVVARDETVLRVKKHKPKNNEKERLRTIQKCKVVDKVVLGNRGDKYKIIKEHKPNIICLGYDQEFFIDQLKEKLNFFNLTQTKIIRLKPYKEQIYKSSLLK